MKRNKIALVSLSLVLLIGSTLAYFTDTKQTSFSAIAGDLELDVKTDGALELLKPGDARLISTKILNKGNISGLIRDQIALTVQLPGEIETEYKTIEEVPYLLYNKEDVVSYDESVGYVLKDGAEPLEATLASAIVPSFGKLRQTVLYEFDEYELASSEESLFEYMLVVDKDLNETTTGIRIEYLSQAKQLSTSEPWVNLESETIEFGYSEVVVVPPKTDVEFNIMTYVDEAGKPLNIPSQKRVYGEDYDITTKILPDKDGKHFVGWKGAYNGSDSYRPLSGGRKVENYGNMEMKPVYGYKLSLSLELERFGATAEEAHAIDLSYGEEVSKAVMNSTSFTVTRFELNDGRYEFFYSEDTSFNLPSPLPTIHTARDSHLEYAQMLEKVISRLMSERYDGATLQQGQFVISGDLENNVDEMNMFHEVLTGLATEKNYAGKEVIAHFVDSDGSAYKFGSPLTKDLELRVVVYPTSNVGIYGNPADGVDTILPKNMLLDTTNSISNNAAKVGGVYTPLELQVSDFTNTDASRSDLLYGFKLSKQEFDPVISGDTITLAANERISVRNSYTPTRARFHLGLLNASHEETDRVAKLLNIPGQPDMHKYTLGKVYTVVNEFENNKYDYTLPENIEFIGNDGRTYVISEYIVNTGYWGQWNYTTFKPGHVQNIHSSTFIKPVVKVK